MPAFAAAVATVASREPWLQVCGGEPDGEGWQLAADLLTPQTVRELVDAGARRVAEEHPAAGPGVARTVAAAVLLDHWSWALAVPGAGVLAASEQVLDLAPERTHLRLHEGQIIGVAVERFADDRGEAALRAEFATHLRRLHTLLTSGNAPLLRRSDRLLQGGLGDALATALAAQAAELDERERERLLGLADRLLLGAGTWGKPGWLIVEAADARKLRTRRRTSCCLWYRLPDQSPCLTCPRLSQRERTDRLQKQPLPATGPQA